MQPFGLCRPYDRVRSNNVDLNRNFPDPIRDAGADVDLRQPQGREQPETLAIMNYTLSNRCVWGAGITARREVPAAVLCEPRVGGWGLGQPSSAVHTSM